VLSTQGITVNDGAVLIGAQGLLAPALTAEHR
jgi:hypothetical protein